MANPEHRESSNRPFNWREAIWSIPRPFVLLYFALLTIQGWPAMTAIIWEQAQMVTASGLKWYNWAWYTEVVRAAAPEIGQVGIGIAIYTLVTVQGVAFLMVLYNFMLEAGRHYLIRPVIKRQEERGEARGEARGEERGQAQADQEWNEWLARKEAAESQGLPFDEPRPSVRRREGASLTDAP